MSERLEDSKIKLLSNLRVVFVLFCLFWRLSFFIFIESTPKDIISLIEVF